MELGLYKLNFQRAHFGDGYLNTSQFTFQASLLFSALCLEAIKNNCLDEWLKLAKQEDFKLSDAFPYYQQPYFPLPVNYLPKPKLSLASLRDDNNLNKAATELNFFPLTGLSDLINHQLPVRQLLMTERAFAKQTVIMKKGEDPYEVGVTNYQVSLYVLASATPLFEELLTSLQYTGIGGKRSSGYGRFEFEKLSLPEELIQALENSEAPEQLLLTTSLPQQNELSKVLEDSEYRIIKNSGFIDSPSQPQRLRKEDLYKFKAGSLFKSRYQGSIVDVRPIDFPTPVLNFAKGLFIGIGE